MSDNIPKNADECAIAINRALDAMKPPLDVYEGIVRLIAELVSYAHFETNSAYFRISDDGVSATRNAKEPYNEVFVCVSPSFREGCHEATFHVDLYGDSAFALGAVPAAKASHIDWARKVGYVYHSSGNYYEKKGAPPTAKFPSYRTGDTIAVRLDLDASTIAFRKNGKDVSTDMKIAHGEAYYFAFDSIKGDDAVTIVEMT